MPELSTQASATAPTIEELLAQAVDQSPAGLVQSRPLLREDVYARIRGWIVEGLLPPDVRLRDKEIAEVLQVSRTPVREAIRRLQDEGLVVTEASRWTKVAPLDTSQANRLYPITWTLERLAVRMSRPPDAERIAALRATNERLRAAMARGDAVEASRMDTEFHRIIVDGAGNAELAGIIGDLKTRLRRLETAYFGGSVTAEPSVQEHERAIAALEAGDLEQAGLEIERNWRASLDRLHQRLAGPPGSPSPPTDRSE
jgi:DNA-binding GntR family transcriptional regulator